MYQENAKFPLIKKFYQKFYYLLLKRHYYALTSSSRVLPDFIIIGTVRSGTTSLYYNMCEHPCIIPAAYDEIGFFDSNYHLGLSWYKSMFTTRSKKNQIQSKNKFCITGEDTPFYIWNPIAAKRIQKLLPNVKIISQLRNPIDRAYSNYQLGVREGHGKLSFEQSIDLELKNLEKETSDNYRIETFSRPFSYISKGLYARQLQIWFDLFPKENILITSTEEMAFNPQHFMNKIFDFLNISKYDIKNPQKRKSENYPKIKSETRKLLIEYFKPYNEKLYKLIGKSFDWDK